MYLHFGFLTGWIVIGLMSVIGVLGEYLKTVFVRDRWNTWFAFANGSLEMSWLLDFYRAVLLCFSGRSA